MGKMQRSKGSRVEREIVNRLKEEGIIAKRVPLSGAAAGYKGDVCIQLRSGEEVVAEVKSRKGASGWRLIKQWLGENDMLFLRQDGDTEPLVVLPFAVFLKLWRL